MKYQYYCTRNPELSADATSPIMDSEQMTRWLNDMASRGWEFVGCGCTHWNDRLTQDWWIFKKEAK